MLRKTILYLSNQPQLFRFVRNNRLARKLARRFVAGETIEEALDVVAALNARGITASLDLLGESVFNEQEARASGREYLTILDRIHERKLDANVSVKLTAMGLDIDEDLCVEIMHAIIGRAREYGSFVRIDMEGSDYTEKTLRIFYERLFPVFGNFVRIDMEGSDYTEKTLRIFYERLFPVFGNHVGIVLQSYLYRTDDDVKRAVNERVRVRLCKGAYQEPETVAYPKKADVDASYVRGMHALMREGNYPGLATHDEALIAEAKQFASAQHIPTDRYEFQMLYGVRRDLQDDLVREGYRLRVYVPFGTQWYPYLMRRLAERPANIVFITGNLVREAFRRKRA